MPFRIFIICVLLAAYSAAGGYWVASTGSNSASGADSAHAFRTIDYAYSRIGNRDTIYVCAGWYEGSIQLSSGKGFYVIGRGDPGPTWSGGRLCSNWTYAGSGLYVTREVTSLNTYGVWLDRLHLLTPTYSRNECAGVYNSYYFNDAGDSLFVHLDYNDNPADHSIEVSTSSTDWLIRCSYCNLDGAVIGFENITFNLCDGIAIDFSAGVNSAPDSIIFDNVVIRNNTTSSSTWAPAIRFNWVDGSLSRNAKHIRFSNSVIWSNIQRGAGPAVIVSDFPGIMEFDNCTFAENKLWGTNDGYKFNDTHDGEYGVTCWAIFRKCLFAFEDMTNQSHALISMSVKHNLFDSCAFVGNVAGVDGTITYQDCDSSTVTYCTFIADSASQNTGEGAISAAFSSVHPGNDHSLYIKQSRVIDCYAHISVNPSAASLFMARSSNASRQRLYWIDNWVVGAHSGYGLTLQDASLVDIIEHRGCVFSDINRGNYFFRHASNGDNVNPFGGYDAEYDTTLDSHTMPDIIAEQYLLSRLKTAESSFQLMRTYFSQYWMERNSSRPPDEEIRRQIDALILRYRDGEVPLQNVLDLIEYYNTGN